MAEHSAIEWCDHTWSPWEGCQKVGPGCDHCYAEARNQRFTGGANWGPGAPRRLTASWDLPDRWNRAAAKAGVRRRIFPSLCDPFDNAVPEAWRDMLFAKIMATPHLDWLLLTKRIGNAAAMLPGAHKAFGGWDNVWIGATVVNQEEADRDIPKLLATPARVRFLSIEPMLGPVELPAFCACGCRLPWERAVSDAMRGASALNREQAEASVKSTLGIDWVIAGGESGPHARPMHPDWARSVRDQCAAAGVPFLFKQWGEWIPVEYNAGTEGHHEVEVLDGCGEVPREGRYQVSGVGPDKHPVVKVGKKAAGRLLDGAQHDGFPRAAT